MTWFGSRSSTLAFSLAPQNGTRNDLRRSEIKIFPGGRGMPPDSPCGRASCALLHFTCFIMLQRSSAHWNTPFQNPRSTTACTHTHTSLSNHNSLRSMASPYRWTLSSYGESEVCSHATLLSVYLWPHEGTVYTGWTCDVCSAIFIVYFVLSLSTLAGCVQISLLSLLNSQKGNKYVFLQGRANVWIN